MMFSEIKVGDTVAFEGRNNLLFATTVVKITPKYFWTEITTQRVSRVTGICREEWREYKFYPMTDDIVARVAETNEKLENIRDIQQRHWEFYSLLQLRKLVELLDSFEQKEIRDAD